MSLSSTSVITLHTMRGEPQSSYADWVAQQGAADGLLRVAFSFSQYWLADAPEISLTALYLHSAGQVSVAVTDQVLVEEPLPPAELYHAWARRHGFASVTQGRPLALQPQYIAKPWGQEIWFTGVEIRAVCCFAAGGGETPIPWLQAVLPEKAVGEAGRALVLLKILDPRPEPVLGDLYFELHEEKREVYVVTGVDEDAWPGGTGYIRYGFDPKRLAQYPNDAAFRQAYLDAVQGYEAVRRALDNKEWADQEGRDGLVRRELSLRAAMNEFTAMRPLKLGDVVKVPLLVPHSLQHGVRTVEFQTPVYERKILSFAQQVVTQDHWDTKEAVAQMSLAAAAPETLEVLLEGEGLKVERIVDFSDFEVRRVRLQGGQGLALAALPDYALVMLVAGSVHLAGADFGPGEAFLLPRHWSGELVSADPAAGLIFLLALPRN